MALSDVNTDGSLTLVVGRNTGASLDLRKISISVEVATEFRTVAEEAAAQLSAREAETWSPEGVVAPETYLKLSAERAGQGLKLSRKSKEHGESLLPALDNASLLEPLPLDKAKSLALYAFVIGDGPQRSIFLRRMNPVRGFGRGLILTSLRQTLVRVEGEVLGFDRSIDIIAHGEEVAVFSQSAFNAVFRNNEELLAQVPAWVDEIASHLPLPGDGPKLLAEACQRDSRVRRRLEAIRYRGHLATADPAAIRASLERHGLDADELMNDQNELVLTKDIDVARVLQVLNEDRFFGDITGAAFRADRKSAAT